VTSVGQADILTRGLGWVFGDGDGDGSGFYSPSFLLARQCSNNKSELFDNAANLHERAKGGEGQYGVDGTGQTGADTRISHPDSMWLLSAVSFCGLVMDLDLKLE